MFDVNYVLLYVNDPPASAAFYAGLTGREPVENSPTFALHVLPSGVKLGLWKADGVEPKVEARPGGNEIALSVADAAAVQAVHREWKERGLPILQEPTRMDFGHTFVAADPDGHRLRVFALDFANDDLGGEAP